jgi:hypothetical protein
MQSAKPPTGSSVARTLQLHRTPGDLDAVIPQKVVVTAAQAPNTSNVSSWFGTTWHFYLVGSSTWAAQFSVDVSGIFTLFVYSAPDPSLTGCVYSVLDQLTGQLVLGADANGAPYLSFPPTSGTETIQDDCGFGGGGTKPLNFNYAWYIRPYNAAGAAWEFIDAGYNYPFNNFIFRSGPLNAAAVQAAASSAADHLKELPGMFQVKQST